MDLKFQTQPMRVLISILSVIFFLSCNRKIEVVDTNFVNPIEQGSITRQFPDDWLGYWTGDLHIYNENGKSMTVPMALDNAPTSIDSIWTWAIIYGEDTIAGRRDYELQVVDRSKGHYIVDEKNSIFLDAFLLDNSLISTFKVGGSYLQSTYELQGEDMLFSISVFPEEEIRTTGDTIHLGEEIPLVYSYKNTVLQKARLRKER